MHTQIHTHTVLNSCEMYTAYIHILYKEKQNSRQELLTVNSARKGMRCS